MLVTFLDAKTFESLARKYRLRPKYFHAGFGIGRNVEYVMRIDDRYYLKLSPIANHVYANASQVVNSSNIQFQIMRKVG